MNDGCQAGLREAVRPAPWVLRRPFCRPLALRRDHDYHLTPARQCIVH